jgi:hypothetical protein
MWLSRSATPLERPKELEGRAFLTDTEVAELKRQAARIFKDSQSDYAAGDYPSLAALANVEHFKDPATTGAADDDRAGIRQSHLADCGSAGRTHEV